MASYDAKVGEHTVTITYVMGGTNQIGVKKPSKVKAWAICPVSGKRIEEASNSVGEATRAVESSLAKSIEEAENASEPAQV